MKDVKEPVEEPADEPAESVEEMESARKTAIHAVVSFVLGMVILALLAGMVLVLVKTKPKAVRENPKPLLPVVDVWEVSKKARRAEIVSQGVVESVREVVLAAEVAGRVVAVSPQLLRGAKVAEGDVLVELEQADYLAELELAKANLKEAELVVAQEEAVRERAAAAGRLRASSSRRPSVSAANDARVPRCSTTRFSGSTASSG